MYLVVYERRCSYSSNSASNDVSSNNVPFTYGWVFSRSPAFAVLSLVRRMGGIAVVMIGEVTERLIGLQVLLFD